jgi:hypothetical protein
LLCAGVLLGSALLSARSPAEAKGTPHGPTRATGWSVLAPVTYKNLTLFPVRGADVAPAGDYVTLDEGLKSGAVVITERGGTRTARGRNGRVRRISMDDASVNELALVNRSGKKLLLLAGEVVVGGKQDRIVQEDRVVPPVSVPVSLEVFCVEHGRWSERASGSGRGYGGPVIAAPVQRPETFNSLGAVAHPKLRAAAQDRKEQSAVWNEVSENNAKLGTQNGTDTYQQVYQSKKVSGQLSDYVRALEREVLQPGVVGVVVARNGELVWADVFAGHALFSRYWPKLLKSYAVDAMADYKRERVPTFDEARAYLNDRRGEVAATTQRGVYQLFKTENPSFAIFELTDISLVQPRRLHFNKMQR